MESPTTVAPLLWELILPMALGYQPWGVASCMLDCLRERTQALLAGEDQVRQWHVVSPQLPWAKQRDSAIGYILSCIHESVSP